MKTQSANEITEAFRAKLVSLLKSVEGANEGSAALLIYVLAPQIGLQRIERALASSVPLAYEDAAAACVVIEGVATKDLLLKALDSPNLQLQHVAACALKFLPDSDSAKASAYWNAKNDGIAEPEGKPVEIGGRAIKTFSMDEVSHANMDALFRGRIDAVKEDFGDLIGLWQSRKA
jgi:hypothetical protein